MFYTFDQNNSGGYFVTDEANGIGETVIIEADNAKSAFEKLNEIGERVSGFSDFCHCCGERWSTWIDDDDGTEQPERYGEDIFLVTKDMFRNYCFIHYLNNEVKRVDFK